MLIIRKAQRANGLHSLAHRPKSERDVIPKEEKYDSCQCISYIVLPEKQKKNSCGILATNDLMSQLRKKEADM